MITECLSIVFCWSSLLLSDIQLPNFDQNINLIRVSNLSYPRVRIGATRGTFNSSHWSLVTAEPSIFNFSASADALFSTYTVCGDMQINPSHFALSKSVDGACLTNDNVTEECDFNPEIGEILFDPSNLFLQIMVRPLKGIINKEVRRVICQTVLPRIKEELRNHTEHPPTPHPLPGKGVTHLEDVPLFRAIVNMARGLPPVPFVEIGASLHSGATLRLVLGFTNGLHLASDDLKEPHSIWRRAMTTLKSLQIESIAEGFLGVIASCRRWFRERGCSTSL
ncbi:hypothetical protein DQ04_06361010 [Trypanosoma grayi]|uniref:hypothetical protein n=1 Tax=Trypanosoma grayi TaxID=71804 RepID=UPI0004F452B8|nr:hypothetical protein DQ04_06361010 [Trypanosoma grayi]KEG08831.1 hypothetical protein DQ04_06361010 [Trypanosoma grayi]